jgi:hypothetical protein
MTMHQKGSSPDRTVLPEKMGVEPLKQLLLRGWMTHDAMWFKNALQRIGIELTNEINRAAVRDMAPIEVARVLKALRMDRVSTLDELETFLTGAMSLLSGDFMTFSWQWQPPDLLVARVSECFAHKGIERMGVIAEYECGIFERIYGWFDALGIGYDVVPNVSHCTLHHDGSCVREIRFSFDQHDSEKEIR